MPVQTAKNPTSAALKRVGGLDKAFNAHKSDETKLSQGGGLPDGIEGGVAQLTDAKIGIVGKDKANAGAPYVYFRAVIKEPKEYAGRQMSSMDFIRNLNLFGTQEQIDKAVAEALNEMRKLGIATEGLELDDWEPALEALKEASPHFHFRTWSFPKEEIVNRNGKWFVVQGGKDKAGPYASEDALKKANKYAGSEPRVFADWRGLVTGFVDSSSNGEAVQDHTGEAPSDDGDASSSSGSGSSEEADYLALGNQADEGDAEAGTALLAKAEELGIKDEVEGAKKWVDGAQLILDKLGSGETGGESESSSSEPFEPVKGNIYSLKAKGAKKFEDFECTAVFKTTVNLKRLSDDKVFTKVEWTADPPQIWGQDVEV